MKKILTVLIAISVIGLVSCEKDSGPSEAPGNIPGFSKNSTEKPEVKEEFVMPDDIILEGKITGTDNLKSTSASSSFVYGSGGDVKLKLTLKNTSNRSRTIFLPKGLIWESTSAEYQHGIQLQTIWISLMGKQTKEVVINLYCANFHLLPGPDHNIVYHILGVTSSRIIWRFLDMIGWKMINYEMFAGNQPSPGSHLKSGEGPSIDVISARLQSILHKLTDNGSPITDEDISFIESIPDVENEDARNVLGKDVDYPEYLEEYSELVKK
ncbi:hypothetical protein SAMN06265379_10268 [Saccharicrinis carchari]|uniref:Lipoprotein n=1 Tax=Saccharicrinis carchari TaxID=1168039 RepID=A0A521BWI8_SACCC|nr:hypothetical protein [Saccharicrinis carchari]SMO50800.1 hypothetical protein SAMN06265379_10268 [Saccharicrinis carchari]